MFLSTLFVPNIYQPRRPRASPLWQIVHHGWDAFLALYEKFHRNTLGPLDPAATVQSVLRCDDLASGSTRLQCPDCDHERHLAFTCKGRHFCPACHQRRTRLNLPDGKLAAVAGVHTFGDYLIFHPHLHVLAPPNNPPATCAPFGAISS